MNENMIKRSVLSGVQEGRMAESEWLSDMDGEQDDLGAINSKIEEIVTDLSEVYNKEEVIKLSERLLNYYKENDLDGEISDPSLAEDVQRAVRVVQAERRKREKDRQAQLDQIRNEMKQASQGEKREPNNHGVKNEATAEKKSGFMSGLKKFFSS